MDIQTFKDAMSRFASGVTVIIVSAEDGYHGKTVSSFFSLSIDPLMVGFALNKGAPFIDMLKSADSFTISILNESQTDVSRRFANRETSIASSEELCSEQGWPEALSVITCAVENTVDGGDHTVVMAKVLGATNRPGYPLVYSGRQYHSIRQESQ